MARKSVIVTSENSTGRNTRFQDQKSGQEMTRAQFAKQIRQGNYPEYHVRVINGVQTPVSNPDGSSGNNLG